MRWQHPERGLVSALDIIPIAEEGGMIVEMGAWVLRESCMQLARWREAGIPNARLAVNVSALQIHKNHFIDRIKEVFDASRIDPSTCEMEITGSTLQHRCLSLGAGWARKDLADGHVPP